MAEKNECLTDLPELPAATAQEALAKNFYDWERRGRGWYLWVKACDLEPPFRPFFHWLPPRFYQSRDDGRIPSLASTLFTKLEGWWKGRSKNEGAASTDEEIEISEPEAEVYPSVLPLIEIEIALPPALRITKEVTTQLFISLSYCAEPLAFEVIGTDEAIIVQLVCREPDLYPLRQQFAAYFSEAVLTERRHFLSTLWLSAGDAGVLVDFGLSHEFVMPLKTFGNFETDPLIAFAGALADLQAGEVGVLQVMFQPTRHPWAENILRAVTLPDGKPFFDGAPELVAQARHKISQPLYAAAIRIAARAPEEDRAWQIVKALGGALQHFGSPATNEFIPLENGDCYPDSHHEEDLLGRQSHRTGMLLNSDELVSLVHPPSSSVRAKKLRRQSQKTKAAPDLALGHELLLGVNEHEGEERIVSLSADQRCRHTYVIGASGTGKSTFLLCLIAQDISQGNGFAVLDPHGDLIDQILERIPEERFVDVVLFDPSDEEYPIGFNILSAHSEIEKHLLASDLASVFKRLSTSWGDQMTSVLGNAILAFLESERGGTLADLRRFLVEKEYRQEFLKTVKDPENVYYWTREFPLLTGKPQAPLLTRLDTFLRPRLIRYMVAQKENKLDFADIMNGKKIFLAKLAQGAIGEENAYLLGTLLVSKFHQMTLARQDMKAADRDPFYLYIDEFHNFVTPSMASILAGARKYRLGLILAHQELRQLGSGTTEIESAVISNPYTRICFRLGDHDAKKLADGFSFFEAKDLQNLGTGEAIGRIERAEFDFNLRTDSMPAVEPNVARERIERITQLSRQRYGTRREVVEAALAKSAPDLAVGSAPTKDKTETKPHERGSAEAKAVETPKVRDAASETAVLSLKPTTETPLTPTEPPLKAELISSSDVPTEPKMKRPIPAMPTTMGRGGPEHKHLQRLIKLWAEGMNWRVSIEKSILDGAGAIDVALEKGNRFIACEICVTTPVEKEVANIEKCLKAEIEHIVSISNDPTQLGKIRAAATKKIPATNLARVQFLSTDELFRFVEELDAQSASTEKRTKGFKVKVKYRPADLEARTAKNDSLSASVAESMEKMRKIRK